MAGASTEQWREDEVRVLIRSTADGMYWRLPKGWVQERENAADFGKTWKAVRFSEIAGLRRVEVIMAFRDPGTDVLVWEVG